MKKYILTLVLIFTPLLALPVTVSAVDVFQNDLCDQKQREGGEVPSDSAICKDKNLPQDSAGNTQNPLFGPQGAITRVINILTVLVSIIAIIMIILAGLKFVTSGNNSQDAHSARERVIYACVALVVAASAQLVVRFVLDNI